MRSINKIIIVGNLTRDPEMRQTPSGQYVCSFGVATNREWLTRDNRREKSTEFHECIAWARLAEICNMYLQKGKLVYVEGYIKTRSWDTATGTKNFRTEIIVQDMIILEKRPASSSADYVPTEDNERNHQSIDKTEYEKELKEDLKNT